MKSFFVVLILFFAVAIPEQGLCSRVYVSNSSVRISSQTLPAINYYRGTANISVSSEPGNGEHVTCAYVGGCWLGPIIFFYQNGKEKESLFISHGDAVQVDGTETLDDALAKWVSQYGSSSVRNNGVQRVDIVRNGDEPFPDSFRICFGAYPLTTYMLGSSLYIASNCQSPPPLSVSCTSLPDMNFAHGSIAFGNNLQSRKDVSATLECSEGATSVTFSLSAPIKLDNSIVNHFYLNDQLLDSTPVTINVGGASTPLIFSSVIESATTGGEFQGSAVLIMAVN